MCEDVIFLLSSVIAIFDRIICTLGPNESRALSCLMMSLRLGKGQLKMPGWNWNMTNSGAEGLVNGK